MRFNPTTSTVWFFFLCHRRAQLLSFRFHWTKTIRIGRLLCAIIIAPVVVFGIAKRNYLNVNNVANLWLNHVRKTSSAKRYHSTSLLTYSKDIGAERFARTPFGKSSDNSDPKWRHKFIPNCGRAASVRSQLNQFFQTPLIRPKRSTVRTNAIKIWFCRACCMRFPHNGSQFPGQFRIS